MDFYGFAEVGTEFPKPKLADFAEGQDYDYYAYDMAMDQWQSQFPNLSERWCGEQTAKPAEDTRSIEEILFDALAA